MKLIKTDLRGQNALQVLTRARLVRLRMKGNPLFPDPSPAMPAFEDAIERLAASVRETSSGGDRLAFVRKQAHLNEVSAMIKSLAAYVSIVAQGDVGIMLAAGFEQRKPSKPITTLTAPRTIRAKSGLLHGTIDLRWSPVHGARMYRVFIAKGYASSGPGERDLMLSASRCTIDGLEPLEYYTFRVQAIGVRAVGPISAMATALSIGFKAA